MPRKTPVSRTGARPTRVAHSGTNDKTLAVHCSGFCNDSDSPPPLRLAGTILLFFPPPPCRPTAFPVTRPDFPIPSTHQLPIHPLPPSSFCSAGFAALIRRPPALTSTSFIPSCARHLGPEFALATNPCPRPDPSSLLNCLFNRYCLICAWSKPRLYRLDDQPAPKTLDASPDPDFGLSTRQDPSEELHKPPVVCHTVPTPYSLCCGHKARVREPPYSWEICWTSSICIRILHLVHGDPSMSPGPFSTA